MREGSEGNLWPLLRVPAEISRTPLDFQRDGAIIRPIMNLRAPQRCPSVLGERIGESLYPRRLAVQIHIPEWMDSAKCRDGNVDMFGPPAKAKAVCRACPVVSECQGYAVALGITSGVWGGRSVSGLATRRGGGSKCTVYVVQIGNFIKIGSTNDFRSRLSTLRLECPTRDAQAPEILLLIEATRAEETELLRLASSISLPVQGREWFLAIPVVKVTLVRRCSELAEIFPLTCLSERAHTPHMDNNLIGAHEAAELLGVSVATVKRLAATGTIPTEGKPSGAWVFSREAVLNHKAAT